MPLSNAKWGAVLSQARDLKTWTPAGKPVYLLPQSACEPEAINGLITARELHAHLDAAADAINRMAEKQQRYHYIPKAREPHNPTDSTVPIDADFDTENSRSSKKAESTPARVRRAVHIFRENNEEPVVFVNLLSKTPVTGIVNADSSEQPASERRKALLDKRHERDLFIGEGSYKRAKWAIGFKPTSEELFFAVSASTVSKVVLSSYLQRAQKFSTMRRKGLRFTEVPYETPPYQGDVLDRESSQKILGTKIRQFSRYYPVGDMYHLLFSASPSSHNYTHLVSNTDDIRFCDIYSMGFTLLMGCASLHAMGLVHGDLSISNVLVRKRGEGKHSRCEAVVSDLDNCRTNGEHFSGRHFFPNPMVMPPEAIHLFRLLNSNSAKDSEILNKQKIFIERVKWTKLARHYLEKHNSNSQYTTRVLSSPSLDAWAVGIYLFIILMGRPPAPNDREDLEKINELPFLKGLLDPDFKKRITVDEALLGFCKAVDKDISASRAHFIDEERLTNEAADEQIMPFNDELRILQFQALLLISKLVDSHENPLSTMPVASQEIIRSAINAINQSKNIEELSRVIIEKIRLIFVYSNQSQLFASFLKEQAPDLLAEHQKLESSDQKRNDELPSLVGLLGLNPRKNRMSLGVCDSEAKEPDLKTLQSDVLSVLAQCNQTDTRVQEFVECVIDIAGESHLNHLVLDRIKPYLEEASQIKLLNGILKKWMFVRQLGQNDYDWGRRFLEESIASLSLSNQDSLLHKQYSMLQAIARYREKLRNKGVPFFAAKNTNERYALSEELITKVLEAETDEALSTVVTDEVAACRKLSWRGRSRLADYLEEAQKQFISSTQLKLSASIGR